MFPRPVAGALRPVVRSQTQRYNTKIRAGRGFTLEELKAAGIPAKYAPTIGICVDHRRKNRSTQSLEARHGRGGRSAPGRRASAAHARALSPQANKARLDEYKSKLILFPRRNREPGKADAPTAELASAAQLTGALLPITKPAPEGGVVAVTAEMKAAKAYATLRLARVNARMVGKRAKKAAEAEKEAEKNK